MNAPISTPADCEVRGVIRFLQAENVRPSEIHRRLVAVYGEHVMDAASVRKWCTMFTNGRTDVHDAERSGRSFVITDPLKEKLNRIIRENRHCTISEVYKQCPEVSRTVLYEIVTRTFAIPVVDWLNSQAAVWYEEGINKLVSRYDKCLSVQGYYVEK